MKTKLVVIALIAVFTVSFAFGDAEARRHKSTHKLMPIAVSEDNSQTVQVQQRLEELGYNPGPIDGVFGSQTADAVRQFQQDQGLDADGIIGPATLAALGL